MRVTNKVASRRRRKKFLKLAKGSWGRRKNVWTVAKHHIEKGLQYAYRDRRARKREFRRLWISRINAAVRQHGMTYSQFIHGLKQQNVQLDRKSLAYLAMNDPEGFQKLVALAQEATQQAA